MTRYGFSDRVPGSLVEFRVTVPRWSKFTDANRGAIHGRVMS